MQSSIRGAVLNQTGLHGGKPVVQAGHQSSPTRRSDMTKIRIALFAVLFLCAAWVVAQDTSGSSTQSSSGTSAGTSSQQGGGVGSQSGNTQPGSTGSPSGSAAQTDSTGSQSTTGSQTGTSGAQSGTTGSQSGAYGSQSGTTGSQAGETSGNTMPGQTKIRGCLTETNGNYKLTDEQTGTSYSLIGSQQIGEHVGHEVEVQGVSTSTAQNETSSPKDNNGSVGQNTSSNPFQVKSIKHISSQCNGTGNAQSK